MWNENLLKQKLQEKDNLIYGILKAHRHNNVCVLRELLSDLKILEKEIKELI